MSMSKNLKFVMIICLGVGLLFISVNNIEAAELTLKLGHIYPATSVQGIANEKFADLVEEYTNGEIEVNVFHSAQLGRQMEMIQGVSMGTIDFYVGATDSMCDLVPKLEAIAWHFIFKDRNHVDKFYNSDIWEEIQQELINKWNIKVLAANWERGPFKVFISKKPLFTLKDLKGSKMRVPETTVMLKCWTALGADASPVTFGEVYLALKQGIVDSLEQPFDGVYPNKFHEVAPYITFTKHDYQRVSIIMNNSKFKGLSEENRKAISKAAKEAGDYYTKLVYENFEIDKSRILKEHGFIIEIDNSEFREKSISALKEFAKREGTEDIVNEILSLGE